MVSAYTEIISIRVDDALLFKIKENLRPGENVSDLFVKLCVAIWLLFSRVGGF